MMTRAEHWDLAQTIFAVNFEKFTRIHAGTSECPEKRYRVSIRRNVGRPAGTRSGEAKLAARWKC
jgi:hypothetical protein